MPKRAITCSAEAAPIRASQLTISASFLVCMAPPDDDRHESFSMHVDQRQLETPPPISATAGAPRECRLSGAREAHLASHGCFLGAGLDCGTEVTRRPARLASELPGLTATRLTQGCFGVGPRTCQADLRRSTASGAHPATRKIRDVRQALQSASVTLAAQSCSKSSSGRRIGSPVGPYRDVKSIVRV
jgi:hypothetical protein